MAGTYTIDGVDLTNAAGRWFLTGATTLRPTAAPRSVDLKVPNRHGAVPVLNLPLEPAVVGFTLGITDLTAAGAPGGWEARDANLDALRGVLGVRHRLLDLRYTTTTGTLQADAECLSSLEPETVGPTFARLPVVLRIPGALWRDPATADWTQANAVSGTTYTVSTLTGASGPVTDALVLVTGPITNPRVTDVTTGGWMQYDGVVAAGTGVRFDTGALTAVTGSALTFTAAGTDATAKVSTSAAARFLSLTPAMNGTDPTDRRVKVTLTGTSTSSATTLAIRARRAYL